MQTSKRVLPLEQLQLCLAEHVFDGTAGKVEDESATSAAAATPVGLAWDELQSNILVCHAPQSNVQLCLHCLCMSCLRD